MVIIGNNISIMKNKGEFRVDISNNGDRKCYWIHHVLFYLSSKHDTGFFQAFRIFCSSHYRIWGSGLLRCSNCFKYTEGNKEKKYRITGEKLAI